MRLRDAFLVAAIPSATALQQRLVAHSSGAVTPSLNATDFAETITKAPPPLNSVVPNKPAVEASIMGLIVFSAAGLVLL
ncbi:hypothetical protein F5B22DRAFT_645930 [Xylaria bambusicola]|uniref:uncharacterized protein n=1 Tax=Xylaria bambusicola TaxID=326684 RepID=UPI002007313B|nr:uncharacterized protein F5B22DRAFT_645930 [Xylaria bambusicola]KAI0517296.1 hypothetical protein F5B22DRAFT_645930 [Xylaria bambusicola]